MDYGEAGVGWRRVVQCMEGERLIRDPSLVVKSVEAPLEWGLTGVLIPVLLCA